MAKRERSIATKLIDANRWRVHPQEAQQRLQERDQRIAADTRTEVQKYLGDPEPARSALARVTPLGADPNATRHKLARRFVAEVTRPCTSLPENYFEYVAHNV